MRSLNRALLMMACAIWLMVLAGCSWPGGPDGSYHPAYERTDENLDGIATVTGPLPVTGRPTENYGMAVSDLCLALLAPGTNNATWYTPMSFQYWVDSTKAVQEFQYNLELWQVPPGNYDLAFCYSPTGSGQIVQGPVTVFTRGPQVALPGGPGDLAGPRIEFAATGDAPYGTLSGRLLISGNELQYLTWVNVLLVQTERGGTELAAGQRGEYLWPCKVTPDKWGRAAITVPGVAAGEYELSLEGYGLGGRPGLAAYGSPVVIDAANLSVDGIELRAVAWEEEPAGYKSGSISGTVTVTSTLTADTDYIVQAELLRGTTLPEGKARWFIHADELNGSDQASFTLTRLLDGDYRVRIYAVPQTGATEAQAAVELPGPFTLDAGQREITGVALSL